MPMAGPWNEAVVIPFFGGMLLIMTSAASGLCHSLVKKSEAARIEELTDTSTASISEETADLNSSKNVKSVE
jgi:hypothetical protein